MGDPLSSGRLSLLEELGGVLVDARETFEKLSLKKLSLLRPMGVLLLFNAIHGVLAGALIAKALLVVSALFWRLLWPLGGFRAPDSPTLISLTPALVSASSALFALVAWLLLAAIAHLCAKVAFKKTGSYVHLLKLYGYSSTPLFLSSLGLLLLSVNPKFFVYAVPLSAASFIWILAIMVAAVQSAYGLSSGEAFISAFIAPVFLLLAATAVGGLFL
ncbi:TPA: hypothetical protein EYP26_03150 [Candidatus Bathyarchaeota archaeon]|nr:hypothetical protein [Candidatus Bathyarchaeota archaeon]